MVATDEQVRGRAWRLAAALESAERPDGSRYIRLRDGSPAWMTDVIREAHGGMLPDDWVYGCLPGLAEACADADDLDDPGDAAGGEVDTGYAEMLAWLGSGGRWGRVDEALGEGARTLTDAIQWAQYREAEEIYWRLVAALRAIDDADDEGE